MLWPLQALLLSTTLATTLATIKQTLFSKQSVSSASWAATQREEVTAQGLVECGLLCQGQGGCDGFR